MAWPQRAHPTEGPGAPQPLPLPPGAYTAPGFQVGVPYPGNTGVAPNGYPGNFQLYPPHQLAPNSGHFAPFPPHHHLPHAVGASAPFHQQYHQFQHYNVQQQQQQQQQGGPMLNHAGVSGPPPNLHLPGGALGNARGAPVWRGSGPTGGNGRVGSGPARRPRGGGGGLGVSSFGGQELPTRVSNSKQAPAPQRSGAAASPALVQQFVCKSCVGSKSFATAELLAKHEVKHAMCPVDGCTFAADSVSLHVHKMREHGSTRVKFVARPLETPEEIAAYVTLRKERFPTRKRREAAAAAKRRGEGSTAKRRKRDHVLDAESTAEKLASLAAEIWRVWEQTGWFNAGPPGVLLQVSGITDKAVVGARQYVHLQIANGSGENGGELETRLIDEACQRAYMLITRDTTPPARAAENTELYELVARLLAPNKDGKDAPILAAAASTAPERSTITEPPAVTEDELKGTLGILVQLVRLIVGAGVDGGGDADADSSDSPPEELSSAATPLDERQDGLDVADLVDDPEAGVPSQRRAKGAAADGKAADNRKRCAFFQRGSCRHGDQCRFKHERGTGKPKGGSAPKLPSAVARGAAASLMDKLTKREREQDLELVLECFRHLVRTNFGDASTTAHPKSTGEET